MRGYPSKLSEAFKELRKLGYFARQNFWCCQNCAWHAMSDEEAKKAVFWHRQGNKDKENGKPFHLYWSGDANEIIGVLNKHGVKTEWEGKKEKAIKVIQW